jgi:transaldolase/glucose-6-phosphate isomerase
MATLEREGHPIVRIHVKDVWHIGQEFFRWEIATAVAYAVIKRNAVGQTVSRMPNKCQALDAGSD